jgi:hypothetical protein
VSTVEDTNAILFRDSSHHRTLISYKGAFATYQKDTEVTYRCKSGSLGVGLSFSPNETPRYFLLDSSGTLDIVVKIKNCQLAFFFLRIGP